LWKKINEKQGAFAYLAHPSSGDFDNLYSSPYNLSADNSIVGTPARSGPALSTNTNYSDASSSNYVARYNDALKKGYHVGIGLDHDTHNSVFGRQTAGRMVVLAPSLTRMDILSAIKKMRFYSSDDWNTKVNFTISNQPMGSIITQAGSPTIMVSVTDADAENTSSITIYRGIPGSGTGPSILTTISNTANVSYAATVANNASYYYYLKITQADGDIIWTSPIWYKRNDALTNSPPVANFTASTQTICAGQPVTFTDNTSNGPNSWNWNLTGALPSNSTDQNVVATFYAGGTYTVAMNASNAFGTSNTITHTITVKPLPTLVVNSPTICLGETDTLNVTGATSYTWSTGETTSSIPVSPTLTYYYFITGALNGCISYTNTSVIVQACVGIDELSKAPIKLYPNPANQILNIDFNQLIAEKIIEVYDISGKCVLTKTSNETLLELDISSFSEGMYLLKIKLNQNQYFTKKFMIHRN
jgi:PKD repeat protein